MILYYNILYCFSIIAGTGLEKVSGPGIASASVIHYLKLPKPLLFFCRFLL